MEKLDPTAATTMPSANFTRHKTIQQFEVECGFRMILHMHLAGCCSNTQEFCRTTNKLRGFGKENLVQRCRNWVCDMLLDPNANHTTPDWIAKLLPGRNLKKKKLESLSKLRNF